MKTSYKLLIATLVIIVLAVICNDFYQTHLSGDVWDDAARSHYKHIGQ